MTLLAELKRRNVFRMAVLYVVGSWLILQMGDLLFDLMGLPDWSLRIVLGILILGFPVALAFSWLYELTPEGLKREQEVNRDSSITGDTGKRLNAITLAVAVAAIGLVLYQQFSSQSPGIAPTQTIQENDPSGPNATVAQIEEPGLQSIAVLPFRDMSAAGDQDYFAEGIAEELLNALVRIDGLRVASRTSSFSFKGQSLDLPTIADRIGVSHILEGSVRTAGDRIRVTAQLIDVANDAHLWSETFDRTLDDVFAIQDEITVQVVGALVPYLIETPADSSGTQGLLSLAQVPGSSLPAPSAETLTDNAEAYRLYLRGRHQWRKRSKDSLHSARDLFTEAVALDPGFARAWSNLAVTLLNLAEYDPELSWQETSPAAFEAAETALALNPNLGEALVVKADLLKDSCRPVEADAHYRQAIEAEPNDPTVHHWYSNFLRQFGYVEAGAREMRRAYELDPLNASVVINIGIILSFEGDLEGSVEKFREAADLGIYSGNRIYQGIILAYAGELDRAEPMLRDRRDIMPTIDPNWVDEFLAVMRNPALKTEKEAAIEAMLGSMDSYYRYSAMIAMKSSLVLDRIVDDCSIMSYAFDLWRPSIGLRRHPDFAKAMVSAGALDFWRQRGWPDLCRENDDGVLECD